MSLAAASRLSAEPGPVDRSVAARGAMAAALASLALLLATCPILPMSWDEGNAIGRSKGVARWFARWGRGGPEGASPFEAEAIAREWQYATHVEGHPAFYGLAIAGGHWLSDGVVPPLFSYRFGPMLLFSLATGAFYYRLAREFGAVAGAAGVAALLTMPRLFSHAHFASFDGPLTSCWLLAWAAFGPAMRGRRLHGALWGVCLGLTLSCKFTGWLALPPFVLWGLAYGDGKAIRNGMLGLAVAAAVFWLVNPPLWHEPLVGLARFFDLNLHRDRHGLNIPAWFFGERYDMHRPLPWYNSLFWTAVTAPSGTLSLALVGACAAVRGRGLAHGAGFLLLAQWGVLPLVRATPLAPPHDAERLILPSFAFLAALAGVGTGSVWRWAVARFARRGRRRVAAALVAVFAGSASSLAWYAPQWLSYYNVFVGGLRGATALGMEPAYYWDALDGEVLDWLHANVAEGEAIALSGTSLENLMLMQRWGVLRLDWAPRESKQARWFVLQRRPSFYADDDRRLIATGRPAFVKTVRPPDWGWGPWRLDAPVLEVYAYDRSQRTLQETK